MCPSTFLYDPNKTRVWGRLVISLYKRLGLIQVIEAQDAKTGAKSFQATNCTVLNLMLLVFKPMSENNLTICLLVLQVLCSLLAFFIRYGISRFVY